jgi:peptidoglycan/LPS O-acetylase OafA/YrhL
MIFKTFLQKVSAAPRQLFLIDGAGAALSAVLLGVVLVRFESTFGIPVSALCLLASIPVFFVVFDLVSYRAIQASVWRNLKAIAVMNMLYCALSLALAFHHAGSLTFLGWVYIVVEVAVVLLVAALEFRVSGESKSNKTGNNTQ